MDAKATGALIAQRRKQRALSQAELAERIHVTDKAVSRWETGRGMPGLDSLEPLSKALGLSVSELLSGRELTQEELPKAAGGQIMESMKRELTWKWLAWAAMAAVMVLVLGAAAVLHAQAQRERELTELAERERWERYAHYTGSVNPNEEAYIAETTADYFQERGRKTRFNPKSLRVREKIFLEDYMAVLLSDREGEWCLSFWQKDTVYREPENRDRYCILGGRSRIDPGTRGLAKWNFGTREQPVIVVSGAELPEEACFYECDRNGYMVKSWVDPDLRTALDIFIEVLPMSVEQPSPMGVYLCGADGAYLPRDLE